MGLFDRFFKQDKSPKNYQFRIEGYPETMIVEGKKTTLLQVALDEGIDFPYSCRVGSCLCCKCRLIEGKVKQFTDTSYVFTQEELENQYILACQSTPLSDVAIAVEGIDFQAPVVGAPRHKPEKAEGEIIGTRHLTHDIIEISIRQQIPAMYTSGQYADITVSGVIEEPRSYSYAAAPNEEDPALVQFFVRLVPGGAFSGWLHAEDRKGQKVFLDGPYGSFWLRPSSAPMLCIAGGSGMAPLKAILELALKEEVQREVLYLFGARTQKDLYALDSMADLEQKWPSRFRFVPILSEEPVDSDWQGRRGLVTDFIGDSELTLEQPHVYMCGPPPMLDAAMDKLLTLGVPANVMHFDKFLDRSHTAKAPA